MLFKTWVRILLSLAPLVAFSQDVLIPGKTFDREIAGGQKHLYRLTLAAGQYGGFTLDQRGIDVYIQILGDDENPVAEFDADSRKQGRENLGIVAGHSGEYRLNVIARNAKDPSAPYRIENVEVRLATDADRSLYEAHQLSFQSALLGDAAKYDEALKLAQQALSLVEDQPDDAYKGYLLMQRGSLERTKGNRDKAEEYLRRALSVDEKILGRENPQTAIVMDRLGALYLAANDYARAEPLITAQAEILEKSLGDSSRTVRALMDLSLFHQRRGNLDQAKVLLERAVAMADRALDPDDFSLAAAINNLGDLYISLRDYDRAKPLLERSLVLLELQNGPDHPFLANPLQNLGSIARRQKQYAHALDLLWRAEAIRAKSLGDHHPDTAALMINIANVYGSQGDYARALELQQKALEILEVYAGPFNNLTLLALANISRTYAAQGDVPHAIEFQSRFDTVIEKNIQLNLAIGSEREQLAYFASLGGLTDRTISLNVSQAPRDPAASGLAVLILLQRKGRVLDSMSGSRTALRQSLNLEDRALLDRLAEADARLARLALRGPGKTVPAQYRSELETLQQERDKLEAAISSRSGVYRALAQPVTLASVRGAIPPGAALIEFAVYRPFDPKAEDQSQAYGEERYIAYVLRGDGPVDWKDLGPAKTIDAAVSSFREALRDPSRNEVREQARALDRLIDEPLRPLFGSARQLFVAPDGSLNLIPFEALLDERGRYLLERYSITYLTSGRDLLRSNATQANPTRTKSSPPLLLADPLFNVAQTARPPSSSNRGSTSAQDLAQLYFVPLAGTAQEAHAIKAIFPSAILLTGSQATVSALKQAEAPELLHIATHGFFFDNASGNPLLRSGLALAGANLDRGGIREGILTSLEASGLNLWGTKLVTLSACDTGLGEVKNGEGVYGLRRAFLLAGAETLVMSLWPVSDSVTRQLMTDYYKSLHQGLGRGEALHRAQLAIQRQESHHHPFYWASFIQSGEWKNLDGR